jgi:hypothetical protein
VGRLLKRRLLVAALISASLLLASCSNSDYRVFYLKEGIAHFSLEYPADYSVTRIDIRNGVASQYTDIGFGLQTATNNHSLAEISVYAWPANSQADTATLILTGMLAQGETIFPDFRLLDRYSVMIGDMEGQAAVFSWTASPSGESEEETTLPAVSRMVCFRYGDLAWEIHVASDLEGQAQGEVQFQHVLDTFQILN